MGTWVAGKVAWHSLTHLPYYRAPKSPDLAGQSFAFREKKIGSVDTRLFSKRYK